jgi:amino acid transporter
VVAVLGFVGFEQAPVLAEEARRPRRTIPAATNAALGVIAVVYAGAAWAMAAHTGDRHVVAAAGHEGPGLLFGLGSGALSQAAQVLFLTSLFAAALAFHNTTWRYMFALAREGVLPAALARTGASNIPKTASLVQSVTGLVTICVFALAGWPPMAVMFFWLGTTGGFGVLVLLAATSVAVVAFFGRDPHGEGPFARVIAPFAAFVLLTGIVVLAVWHYNLLLGVAPGAVASWALPAAYAAVAAIGAGWGLFLRARRPRVHAAIGLSAHAVTGPASPATGDAW